VSSPAMRPANADGGGANRFERTRGSRSHARVKFSMRISAIWAIRLYHAGSLSTANATLFTPLCRAVCARSARRF